MTPTAKAIFENDNVKITRRRAVFEDDEYLISDITWVDIKKNVPKSTTAGGLLLALGVLGVFLVFTDGGLFRGCEGVVVVMVLGGYMLFVSRKASFTLRLGTSDGPMDVLTSQDEAFVKEIVEAVNTAMDKK